MSNDIHPSILAEYEYEQQFMQSQQKGNRRVKIERGKMWALRFLPAKLGPKGTWFARIARHWLSMKPIICPKYTSPDFGGDPEAYCPCCEIAANLNESADETISKFGYQAQGNPQWLTFCIVFEKDGTQQNQHDLLLPYEFNHYKSTFEELMAVWKTGLRRGPDSILDYKTGNDFVVTKTGKGLKFDKQDAAPIFDAKDPNYKAYIEKIEAGIKMPKIQIPTDDQLHAFSLKIKEWADKLADGQNPADAPRGRRRPAADSDIEEGGSEAGYHENDEPAASAPAPRRPAPVAAAPRRAPAPAPVEPEPVEAPAEDDTNPELAPVRSPAPAARRPAPVAAAAAPRRAPVAAPAPEPEAEEPAPEPEAEEPAPARPAATAPRRPAAPAQQTLAPSANRSRAAAEAKSSLPEEPAEEEELPEEAVDSAPPTEAPMGEAEEQAAPPPVTRKGGAGLGAAIRGKIANVSRQGA